MCSGTATRSIRCPHQFSDWTSSGSLSTISYLWKQDQRLHQKNSLAPRISQIPKCLWTRYCNAWIQFSLPSPSWQDGKQVMHKLKGATDHCIPIRPSIHTARWPWPSGLNDSSWMIKEMNFFLTLKTALDKMNKISTNNLLLSALELRTVSLRNVSNF